MAEEEGLERDNLEPLHEEVNFHLELTPQQLKVTHTALRSLLDDFGHDEHEVVKAIHEVLEKLPDEHSIRAITLEDE